MDKISDYDYALAADAANKAGKELKQLEDGSLTMLDPEPLEIDYRSARLFEYPTPGDFIDAYCKAQAGDDSELQALMAKREVIKAKYPKPK